MTLCEICLVELGPDAGRYTYEDGSQACLSCALAELPSEYEQEDE